ncbi:bacterial alpha-L-rhamnosidase-domain-containing protein [Fusarium oxysporum]|nr:bacterial alpha-L-rhamnosidase-domain-containing protein [Fusarium oxysporum]
MVLVDVQVANVHFQHHQPQYSLGLDDPRPRISWTLVTENTFIQTAYEIEITQHPPTSTTQNDVAITQNRQTCFQIESSSSQLVPWPDKDSLKPRQRVSIRIRAFDGQNVTSWSQGTFYETGLMTRENWACQRISSTQLVQGSSSSQREQLLCKAFGTRSCPITRARLYVVVQGVYEAELNGHRVGDDFLAPGWTVYDNRIRYQTYDVADLLKSSGQNCLGFRLADGWFCGRLGFFGGRQYRWGPFSTLMSQLEITYEDGTVESVISDSSWYSIPGPATKAELYDGEKYDANLAIRHWSSAGHSADAGWESVTVLDPLPASVGFVSGCSEPVRRVETIRPVKLITTPSNKTVVDFGQNLVGYVRIKGIKRPKHHKIELRHAEVLEHGELGLRPLRFCEATDVYICDGDASAHSWEPKFTFHGFRYCQIDGMADDSTLLDSVEAVVCHTDMRPVGDFSCSNENINKLFSNARWSTKGNFLSIPADCPQRDERLGWTGDIAQFAPAAVQLFDCHGFLKDWMVDVRYDQDSRKGVPAYVTPNMFGEEVGIWSLPLPVAIWHDVVVLVPWALYMASGDMQILSDNYDSMKRWIESIPRDDKGQRRLWARDSFQLGDWLDPTAPPEQPMDGSTDPILVADAFLTRSLDLMVRVATALNKQQDARYYALAAVDCRQEFLEEYVSPRGRISSDSQTAYSLAICFELVSDDQLSYAGQRLATIMRRNQFKIGTGFAGTPFLCEALIRTGHVQVAYAVLLCQECPSWLYTVKSGATTMWERWDSMLPNGDINPGEMTSFNHYCFGSVITFLYERLGGLKCLKPGWTRIQFAPQPGGDIQFANAYQKTPYGLASIEWRVEEGKFFMEIVVPFMTEAEVVLPDGKDEVRIVKAGKWSFSCELYAQDWPVLAIQAFPDVGPTSEPKTAP